MDLTYICTASSVTTQPDTINNDRKYMTMIHRRATPCRVYRVCIIAASVPHQVSVHLEMSTPKRNVNTSTLQLDDCVCLLGSCWGSGGRSPNCLWNKKKKALTFAKLATFSRQGISGYWVDPCCVSLPGENDLRYCLPSVVDQGQECVRNVETQGTLKKNVVWNVLMV